jgi:hypothetical protein
MLLARPNVFGETDNPALNIWSNRDDGGNMHLQIISVTLHNYTACKPTDCNMKNPFRKIRKRTSSYEGFYYLVKCMYMILFSFKVYYYID